MRWIDKSPVLTLARLDEFVSALTSVVGTRTLADGTTVVSQRAVHSSGGVAGGVVSEGQGYGLFLAGVLAARLPRDHSRRTELLALSYEFFEGWRRMCANTVANSCQTAVEYLCGTPATHECLPSWQFDNGITAERGTGSAPDGDQDAILGMILLVLATRHDSPRPLWWDELARWTYQSCRAFLHFQSVDHPTMRASNGRPLTALKLGSCWGGWDCTNPSYHGPGHFMAMRDYMLAFAADFGATASEGAATAPRWEALIETTYLILGDAQCPATGLFPNWFIPAQSGAAGAGTTGCSGSGTPPAEYGSEAARTAWRLAATYVLYGDPRAAAMSRRIAQHATQKLNAYAACGSACAASDLETGCLVTSIHSSWLWNGFMLGPTASTLAVPPTTSAAEHASALNQAAILLASRAVNDCASSMDRTRGCALPLSRAARARALLALLTFAAALGNARRWSPHASACAYACVAVCVSIAMSSSLEVRLSRAQTTRAHGSPSPPQLSPANSLQWLHCFARWVPLRLQRHPDRRPCRRRRPQLRLRRCHRRLRLTSLRSHHTHPRHQTHRRRHP
jgi:hypothetical protein